ncbi:MAG: ABC transporter permease [Lachnospiraceae bacterium]|nr:ABC transporter permease [Lachnospiraceae bacterium]
MKNKLSALIFVLNNKKQVWVMILALSLTFMTMYIVNFLFLTTGESFKELFLEQPKKIAVVELSAETMGVGENANTSDEEYDEIIDEARNKIMSDMMKQEGISDVTYTQCLYSHYQGIVGKVGYHFPLLSADRIPDFLEHMEAKLIAGKMPAGDGEILVDEKIIKNMKMNIGGYFNESLYGQNFKVVGILESDYLTCVGTPQGYYNSGWYMVVSCDEQHSDMTGVLNDIGIKPTEYDRIIDSVEWAGQYRDMVTVQLDAALLGIIIVVTVFLAISILVAYISFMRSRVNEYCLYSSIGFGRKEIYGMIMREIFIIFGISLAVGAVVTCLIMLLMDKFVIGGMGLVSRYFSPEHLLRIIAAFAVIIGILQIPISVTINNIKTIDRMDE